MSELQLGLLAIGAVVVAAVLGYNKWQEMKYRRQADAIRSRHEDVLLQAGSAAGTAAEAGNPAQKAERIEPVFEAGLQPMPVDPGAPDEQEAGSASLSETLDFIVPLEAAEDIGGEAVLEAAAVALAQARKPVRWEGFNPARARWEQLSPAGSYTMLRAGLQLVDRRGAASADELTVFGAAVQQVGAAAGALASIPERAPALARAGDLDRFCSDVDIQIAVNLVSAKSAFQGTKVRAAAEAAGLELDGDGKFRRRDDAGRVLYALANMEPEAFRPEIMKTLSTNGLTLELDVPRAPGGKRTFEQFRELARQLAQSLDAAIVDDNRQPLGTAAFDQIQTQLQVIHQSMESRGIPAGSVAALRLFA